MLWNGNISLTSSCIVLGGCILCARTDLWALVYRVLHAFAASDIMMPHTHTFLAFEKDNSVGRMSVHGVVTNEQAQVQAVLNHLHVGFWALAAGKKWVVAQAP